MTIKIMDEETLEILDFVKNFDKDTLYCDELNERAKSPEAQGAEIFTLYEGVLSPNAQTPWVITLEELIKYETLLYNLYNEFWALFNSEAEAQQLKNIDSLEARPSHEGSEDLTIYRNALYLLEELIKRTEAMKKIKKELKKTLKG